MSIVKKISFLVLCAIVLKPVLAGSEQQSQVEIQAPGDYLYLSNGLSITRCNILASGSVNNCVNSGASFLGFVFGIFIDHLDNYLYAANNNPSVFSSPSITRCVVDQGTGTLSSCINAGAPPVNGDIDVKVIAAWNFAYIANSNITNSVTKCDVDPITGIFNNCVDAQATLTNFPRKIEINTWNSVAYFSTGNIGTYKIIQCDVNNITGLLENCFDAGVPFGNNDFPAGLAINPASSAQSRYLYIANSGNFGSGKVIKCRVDNISGDLSSCTDSGATNISSPHSITFNNTGNLIYITNINGKTLTRCNVNLSTGVLSGCVNTGATALSALGVTLY
jgi:6-phosphogluconolactonase (cycloisomerase 2 family)